MGKTTTPKSEFANSQEQPIDGRIKDMKRGRVYFAQPKLRGVRATWIPSLKALITRSGRIYTSVDHIVSAILTSPLAHLPLDGEIYAHGQPFRIINGLSRRKKSSKATEILEFHVFDIADPMINAECRQLELDLTGTFRYEHSPYLKRVPTRLIKNQSQAEDLYTDFLNQGYEGLILRDAKAYYTPGESGNVWRIKPLNDMEVPLVAIELTDDGSDVAVMLLETSEGAVFRLGNLNVEVRDYLMTGDHIGEQVSIAYDYIEKSGVPQCASLIDFRWDK